MTRREWLERVLGATVAATVAPLLDLTDQTPAFWNQKPLRELMQWRVVFPDGNTFSFNGTVLGERLLEDGSVSFTIQPSGPMKISQGESPKQDEYPSEPQATILTTDTKPWMKMLDVDLPGINQDAIEGLDWLPELRRRGAITFKVRF